MKIPSLLKALRWGTSQPDAPSAQRNQHPRNIQAPNATGPAFEQRSVNKGKGIKHLFTKILQLKPINAGANAQAPVIQKLAALRELCDTPAQLLTHYPDLTTDPIIYALARQEDTRDLIKDLARRRVKVLRRYFSTYPGLTLIRETSRWAARKVAIIFSKNIKSSALEELKKIEHRLNDPDTLITDSLKQLEIFEHHHHVISLTDTLTAHLYLSADKIQQLSPLTVQPQSQLSATDVEQLQHEQTLLQHPQPTAVAETTDTAPVQNLTERAVIPQRPLLDNATDNEIATTMQQWRQEAADHRIARTAYINCHKNGLIGRLFENNQPLAEKWLATRLNNLRNDLDKTFSGLLPLRKYKARQALKTLDQLFEQVTAAQGDTDLLTVFLEALQAYENEFDKKPFSLLLDMCFLQPDEARQPVNFLMVTKYDHFLDRAAHKDLQNRLKGQHCQAPCSNMYGLYIPDTATEKTQNPRRQTSTTTHQDKPHFSTPITSEPVNADRLLTETLTHDPHKVQQLVRHYLGPAIADADATRLMVPIDSNSKREDFYRVLSHPHYDHLLKAVQSALIQDAMLEQLVMLEPEFVYDSLRAHLNNQLALQHLFEQAQSLQELLALSASFRQQPTKLLAFIRKSANRGLKESLQNTINEQYLISLSETLHDTSKAIEDCPQKQLINALNAYDVMQLLYDNTLTDTAYEQNDLNPLNVNRLKQKQLIEAELAWRLIKKEQFLPEKKRNYLLPCPARAVFLEQAAMSSSDIYATASHWLRWLLSPYSDKKRRPQDEEVTKQIVSQYVPALRKYYSAPFHINLLRLQQQRFDLFGAQKQYVYAEALKRLADMPAGSFMPNSTIKDCKHYLKTIDVIQKTSAHTRPAEGITESVGSALSHATEYGYHISTDTLLNDIQWKEQLKALNYDYHTEFKKRTGVEFKSTYQRLKGIASLGLTKVKQIIKPQLSVQSTLETLDQDIEPLISEQAIKKLIESFIDKTLMNLHDVRAVAHRHPTLFRKTFGEIANMIPHIARQLGFQDSAFNAAIQNFQAQRFANEFIGNARAGLHDDNQPVTETDKEWIRHIQFIHDASIDFMNLQHQLAMAKQLAAKGITTLTAAGTTATMGPAAGVGVLGLTTSLPRLFSGISAALSPAISKTLIDNMSSESITLVHHYATAESTLDMAAVASTTGYAATQAPQLTSNNYTLTRLFHAGKVLAFQLFQPIAQIKSQFSRVKRSFDDARQGYGWLPLATDIKPLVVAFLGSAAIATVAGASVFLTCGLALPAVFAAIGAFTLSSSYLSSAMLPQNPADHLIGDTMANLKEQLMSPESAIAKKVKKLCTEQAETLFVGHLLNSEAYQWLEQQGVLRHYYREHWQQFCQNHLAKQTVTAEDIEGLEQKYNLEFKQWFKTLDSKSTAKTVSQKWYALQHIDAFLQLSNEETPLHPIEKKLKELQVIDRLPKHETTHFLRLLRDELYEYILLECDRIPDSGELDIIKSHLVKRYRETFLGDKVRKALAAEGQPHWVSFEQRVKKQLKQQHCQRLATRSEYQIKAIINDAVKPLPVTQDKTDLNYSDTIFNEQFDEAVAEAFSETDSDDTFYDALDEMPTPQPDGSSVDPHSFLDGLSIPSPEPDVSYNQIKENLNNGTYLQPEGAVTLAQEIIQLHQPEDLMKASMQSEAEEKAMQKALQCSKKEVREVCDFISKKATYQQPLMVKPALPSVLKGLLKPDRR